LDKKNNKEDQGDKREYTRVSKVISISKIKISNSYTYYRQVVFFIFTYVLYTSTIIPFLILDSGATKYFISYKLDFTTFII
jgi:hypothetical protein